MHILRGRGLEKRFGGLPALAGVDLDVEAGEVFGIIGPNGAGKSTLLKTISGLQKATAGTIELDGRDITGLAVHQVRRAGIAKVLQTPRAFESMTALENAVVGAMFGGANGRLREPEARRIAHEALADVGLGQKADVSVTALNLTDKRLLELAVAIAGRPKVLLLDEVMAGLNPTEMATSLDAVRAVRERLGITIVWVEHVMKAITSFADRVMVLNFGQVLALGPPDEVLRDSRVIEAYLGTSGDTHARG